MTTTTKITERQILDLIDAIVDTVDPATFDVEIVTDYTAKRRDALDKKAAKAKETAAKKKAAGDPLADSIKAVLTTDADKTIEDIIAALDTDTEVSPQMVASRLSRFAKADEIVKGSTKVGTRILTTYRLK